VQVPSRVMTVQRCLVGMALLVGAASAGAVDYPWLSTTPAASSTLHARIAAPDGFTRIALAEGSYAHWLRHLPMMAEGTPVRAFDGRVLERQPMGVIDLDVGDRDLQQCADTLMRLRAEYLRASGRADEVAFHFVSGDLARWTDYRAGLRPDFDRPRGRPIAWRKRSGAPTGDGERVWRGYLRLVFGYASTLSLGAYNPTPKVRTAADIRPGDFFVLGGAPGHTVVVLDVATSAAGDVRLLIGQGFMPAQSMHLVPTPNGGAWHTLDAQGQLHIDAWPKPFGLKSLRTFAPKER
jgi:hypothetical protein